MIKLLNILSEIVVQKDPMLQKIADYVRGGSNIVTGKQVVEIGRAHV